MYENKQQYEEILRDKVIMLEWAVGHPIHHGDAGLCPRCSSSGTFDIEGLGFDAESGNSIYYSTVFNEWRCRRCDFRLCA
ncbi:MAG: hypothetical protein GWO11_08625 [Desulfuromonadales bacterium]|nr:hypothetical protein [Desulfuromonadales bacterium]NIR34360.1 hypothetical protein [Desulfuromonadales bacterium]NIS44321.1 hypothetical protein [Desulfuromonadales bacterium]